jgi:hypothetical protein
MLVRAQVDEPFGIKPRSHEQNKALAAERYAAELKAHEADQSVLVLPGLIADRRKSRVELWVEKSAVELNAPCEFMVVSEASDHTYETLLISFAKPGDVTRALAFLGFKPGLAYDPTNLRYWAKGESFQVRLADKDKPAVPIDSLLLDRRSGKPLASSRFIFTRVAHAAKREGDPKAIDEIQPLSIVSLFNTENSVLQVSRRAQKDVVYQNTVVAPAVAQLDSGLLTLVIEPLTPPGETRVTDLSLKVAQTERGSNALSDADRLKALRVELTESAEPIKLSLPALLEHLAALDRQKHDFFLTLRFDHAVELGNARAMAGVLALIDSDNGVRVEPPSSGQLYYRAFIPDRNLLDRHNRLLHPFELVLSEREGKISGNLVMANSVSKDDGAKTEVEAKEVAVSGPSQLQSEMEAENKRLETSGRGPRPLIVMVFAPSTMSYGNLLRFLGPVPATYRTVYIYLDERFPGRATE